MPSFRECETNLLGNLEKKAVADLTLHLQACNHDWPISR